MRILPFVLMLVGATTFPSVSQAIIPANPRTIMGIDGISPDHFGGVLSLFCRKNACESKLEWHKNGGYAWNLYWSNGLSPASAENVCGGIPHRYCVHTWGAEGKAFMNDGRMLELKKMLEAKGAKVVIMDCSVEPTDHGFDYVCTDGKPPP